MNKILKLTRQYIVFLAICCGSLHTQAQTINITKQNYYFKDDIIFYDLDGKKHSLEELEGDNILLVFWAMWCGTCVDELPKLDNLQKDFRKMPFKVIAISEDYQNLEALESYLARMDLNNVSIFYDKSNNLLRDLAIAGLPTAFFVDSEGKVKIEFKGRIKWESNDVRQQLIDEMIGDYELPKNSFKQNVIMQNM